MIDPDPRSCQFLGNLFKNKGYITETALSGKEGYILALRDRPDVVIFDPALPDMTGLELTRKLRGDRRTAGVLLIALSASTDSEPFGALLAAGCNEYLVKSPETVDRLMTLLQETDKLMNETQPTRRAKMSQGGVLVVFLSAKGGTGTSSMCANIAHALGETHPERELAVLDLVLPLGSIGPIVGYQGEFNLLEAARKAPEELNPDFLRRIAPPLATWGFRLLAGMSDPEASNALDAGRIPGIIQAYRRAFDVVFVDLGRALSRISLPIIQQADLIVMVTASDLATVTLTQTVWHYLQSKGISANHMYVLLNRAVGLEGVSKSDAEQIIGLPIQATIPYMGANFSLANNQHLPILRKIPTDTAALMIAQVSRQILETAYQNRT
ncbi:MAG: response regulator [Anaerolineales bacterium]|nr:response regulator [Anaerolineales bacterium]